MSSKNKEPSPTSSKNTEIIPGYSSMEQFTKDGFKVLMEAIRHSNALPSGRDLDFYNTSDSFKKIINDENDSILRLMNQVMRFNDIDSNIRNKILDDKMELVIEANDVILEKVANNIDELNGIRKTVPAPVVIQTVSAKLPVNGSWNRAATFVVNSKLKEGNENNCIKLITGKNIIRPQKFFKDKIENSNKYPWCPRITDKPNSLKPLAIFLEEHEDRQEYSHPYEYELDRFAPTPEQLLDDKFKPPKSLSETPLVEVNTPEQLDELVETLRSCKEFSVDVEHHSYRSFMGITCLLQISTHDTDYIIDALALRDKLCCLNEVFTRNTIVKIFHGAEKDIEWLQRDLSIYVVNMFDTHQAAKLLEYQGLSLAFLMKKFCNVLPNKQFQLADWRIRPLPEELKTYAREDTHYLIYIYKMLKRELLAKANKSDNLVRAVMERSTDICKRRYFKPILLDDSHLDLYRKCKKMFDNRQLYALKEIYAWRDNLAREEDESLGYVLPNHMLLQMSETLPREMQGILACCNPIPPLVRSHLLELHHIILRARDQPLEKAIMKDTTGRGVLKKITKVNVDSALHCPHDLSKTQDLDNLPTLLDNDQFQNDVKNLANVELSIEKPSSYSVFDSSESIFNELKTFKKLRGSYFSPFERYKLVKPFVVAEDEAAEAQKDEESKTVEKEKRVVEERTDEERIASIRDHFLQLSKKFSEELQAQKQKEEEEEMLQKEKEEKEQSLIQMGGSRKRKRNEISDYTNSCEITGQNFFNPAPNINHNFQGHKNRNRGKKRKFNEVSENVTEGAQVAQKKKKKNKQKKKNVNVNQQQQPQSQNVNSQQHNNQIQQPAKRNKFNNNQRGGFRQGSWGGQRQNQQKNKSKEDNRQNQNTSFAPYDYASVDFRQFQGGAGSANTGAQIKQNFRGKNRKNRHNKRGAKSSTFSNIKA